MLNEIKRDFKEGLKEGYRASQLKPMYRILFFILAMAMIITIVLLLSPPADASLNSIADRYGMNSIYRSSSSYPGAHTEYYSNIHIALYPGVDESLIRSALVGINPFYRFDFIDYRSANVYTNRGLIYARDKHTLPIAIYDNPVTACGSGTHGTATRMGAQIFIQRGDKPSVEWIHYLIEHELDHVYGLPCKHPDTINTNNYWNSKEITNRYTEQTKGYGTVTINRFVGQSSETYTVYI